MNAALITGVRAIILSRIVSVMSLACHQTYSKGTDKENVFMVLTKYKNVIIAD